jgi:hypothetical protein
MTHLWESDHPYYMCEGNYFESRMHTTYESIDEFLEEFGEADIDYNLVVRWDWREGDEWGLGSFNGDDNYRHARLMVQILGQRKAKLFSNEVKVCRADEARIIEYLEKHAHRMVENWHPLLEQNETRT